MVDVGVRSNFVAARVAAQIMVPQGYGLIVAISGYVGVTYTYGVVFGLCKTVVDRMARDMAIELQPHNVASLSLWQGLTMTERAQRNLAAHPELTQSIVTRPAVGCSPEFPGRVIAALATDRELMDLSGAPSSPLNSHSATASPTSTGEPSRHCGPNADPRSGNRSRKWAMDADYLARLDNLLARQDITDCLTRFSRGMDRFDRDLFLSAFHPDAQIAAGDFVGGAADLYEWAHGMHEQGQIATHHNLLNNTCDIDGDTAHSETYFLFAARNRDESNWIAGGRYFDRLERRGGHWRIALRTNAIEWSGTVPTMPIPFADVPDIGADGVPARDRTDPSYQRPLGNRRDLHNPLTSA